MMQLESVTASYRQWLLMEWGWRMLIKRCILQWYCPWKRGIEIWTEPRQVLSNRISRVYRWFEQYYHLLTCDLSSARYARVTAGPSMLECARRLKSNLRSRSLLLARIFSNFSVIRDWARVLTEVLLIVRRHKPWHIQDCGNTVGILSRSRVAQPQHTHVVPPMQHRVLADVKMRITVCISTVQKFARLVYWLWRLPG